MSKLQTPGLRLRDLPRQPTIDFGQFRPHLIPLLHNKSVFLSHLRVLSGESLQINVVLLEGLLGCPAFIQHLLFLSGENLDVGLELGGDFGEAVDFGGALGEVGALS